jgi:uncharacterized protein (DUF433 family)
LRTSWLLTKNPAGDYSHLITIEADKRNGQHCNRGVRIVACDILPYLGSGISADEIMCDFLIQSISHVGVAASKDVAAEATTPVAGGVVTPS